MLRGAFKKIWRPNSEICREIFQNLATKFKKGQCATGSKILTKPEPDRIGIILAGTGPDYKPEKVNRIFKTLIINLQVTNINLHGSFNFEI